MLSVLYELRQAGTKQTDSLKIDVLTSCSACCLCLVFLGICSPLCLSLSFSLLFCYYTPLSFFLSFILSHLVCLSFPLLFCHYTPLSLSLSIFILSTLSVFLSLFYFVTTPPLSFFLSLTDSFECICSTGLPKTTKRNGEFVSELG